MGVGFLGTLGLGGLTSFGLFIGHSYIQLQRQRRTRSRIQLKDLGSLVAPAILRLEDRGIELYRDQITFVFKYFPYTDWGGNSRVKGAMYLTLRLAGSPAPVTAQEHFCRLFPNREYRPSDYVDFRSSSRWTVLLESDTRPSWRFLARILDSLTIDEQKLAAYFQRVSYRPPSEPPPSPEPEPIAALKPPAPVVQAEEPEEDLPPIVREVLPFRGKWALVRTGRWIEIRMGPGGCERQDVFFGTFTFVDRKGQVLGEYERAEEFADDGRALVEKGGKRGYIDESGAWL